MQVTSTVRTPFGGVAGQDAAGPDGLVVGMGVHGHEGEGSLGHGWQRRGRRRTSTRRSVTDGRPGTSGLQVADRAGQALQLGAATAPAAPSGAR